jgi:NAD(P)-dependent dehydrogenase (short-subunit alcohol dehydrogenase family)
MTGEFAARHALVTGGSRGIGLAIAEALADAGASVSLIGRDQKSLESAAERLGPAAGIAAADVTDEAALTAAIETLVAARGPVTILINNAGGVASLPFRRMKSADLRQGLELNLVSAFQAIQAVLPGMVAGGWGRIVSVASTAGLKGYPYVAHYCAAKHGLIGLTRALGIELARTGVTVNALCPGYTETDLFLDAVANVQAKTGASGETARAQLLAGNPQGRPIRPEEVAAAVLWLCGSGAASVTGTTIPIAGGEIP